MKYTIVEEAALPRLKIEPSDVGAFDIPEHVADRYRVVRHEYIALLNQLRFENGIGEKIASGEEDAGGKEHTIEHKVHPLARNY